MWQNAPLFPPSASTIADRVDALYFFLVATSAFFALLIAGLVVVFAVVFRRSKYPRAQPIEGSVKLELVWTVVPLLLSLAMFYFGARLYFESLDAPSQSLELYATGKQWMWKFQHAGGQREINELHVPVHRPVRLTMTSEDVIHSFFVPAFRVKRDVLPGRYTSVWFEANKPGTYHLFCAEYCGTKHSEMIGKVHAMEPQDYQGWLSGHIAAEAPEVAGRKLFERLRCDTCHSSSSQARGPDLAGRFGDLVPLADGRSAAFDAQYTRESILRPAAKLSAGFAAIMPTYEGQLDEDQLLQIIAYLKSLGGVEANASPR